jgi:hypothetical protein
MLSVNCIFPDVLIVVLLPIGRILMQLCFALEFNVLQNDGFFSDI